MNINLYQMSLKENINSILRGVGLKATELDATELQTEQVKLEQQTLDDGVTVIEADSFGPSYAVSIVTEDQTIALPVGKYTLMDGRELVVEVEGIIASITDTTETEEPATEQAPAPTDVPVAASEAPVAKSVIESIIKETKFSKEVEDLKAEVERLKTELSEMKQPEVIELQEEPVKPIVHNPEPAVELAKVNVKGMTAKGRLTEFLNNK